MSKLIIKRKNIEDIEIQDRKEYLSIEFKESEKRSGVMPWDKPKHYPSGWGYTCDLERYSTLQELVDIHNKDNTYMLRIIDDEVYYMPYITITYNGNKQQTIIWTNQDDIDNKFNAYLDDIRRQLYSDKEFIEFDNK